MPAMRGDAVVPICVRAAGDGGGPAYHRGGIQSVSRFSIQVQGADGRNGCRPVSTVSARFGRLMFCILLILAVPAAYTASHQPLSKMPHEPFSRRMFVFEEAAGFADLERHPLMKV